MFKKYVTLFLAPNSPLNEEKSALVEKQIEEFISAPIFLNFHKTQEEIFERFKLQKVLSEHNNFSIDKLNLLLFSFQN